MPERIVALIAAAPDQRERIQRTFLDAGMIDQLVGAPPPLGLYRVKLANEEAVLRLKYAAAANGLPAPGIQRFLDPTPRELAAAPLLYLRAGGPGTEHHHPHPGTSYDEAGACAQCGAGLLQATPFTIRKSDLPRSFLAAGIADDVILHESVAKVFESSGVRGVTFRPVLQAGGAAIPWRQLIVEHTLPPMLASARGMVRGRMAGEQPCGQCARDGWFDTTEDPFIPSYARAALDSMPDIAWTHEMFGTGAWAQPVHGKRWLARRRLIARPALYALLRPLKVRGLRWSPVRVE